MLYDDKSDQELRMIDDLIEQPAKALLRYKLLIWKCSAIAARDAILQALHSAIYRKCVVVSQISVASVVRLPVQCKCLLSRKPLILKNMKNFTMSCSLWNFLHNFLTVNFPWQNLCRSMVQVNETIFYRFFQNFLDACVTRYNLIDL